ncbi:MAG TPA: glycosyltransferase [Campylobacterales bacterium]|nr:glycosyltransferase [Arcobacter sp.]HHD81413.1 glycosyltransferase [Campylobacterales bacterium]
MDIVLYLKNLQGRGVQKVYLNLAKGLQELECSVHFVIRENYVELDNSFLEHFYIFEQNITSQLDKLLNQLDKALLIANDVATTLKLKNIESKNIYYTVHMLWGERIFKQFRFKKWFELKRLYKDKQIIAVSEEVKEDLLNKVKIKPKSIRVIPDCFDIELIQTLAQETIDFQDEYILNIGALSREKNQKLLIESYAQLNSSFDLVILGEGKLRNSLEKLTFKLNISEKVHFLGFKSNPYSYIKNAKLLVATSSNEALPGVVIESLILDTPVVSTDSLGVRSILKRNLSSFIVSKSQDLSDKIYQALEDYPTIKTKDYKIFSYKNIARQYMNSIEREK